MSNKPYHCGNLWKHTISAEFQTIRPQLCGNCTFQKISAPRNQVKLWYIMQFNYIEPYKGKVKLMTRLAGLKWNLDAACGVLILLFRSSHQRCSMKKTVLRNFTKFKGKQLCKSLFFNKVAGHFFTEHLLTTASDFLLS